MNAGEVDRKLSELQDFRTQYRKSTHELQETVRKMTILVSLLSQSPTDLWNSSDRESIRFLDGKDGEEIGISRAELDALPDQISRTLLASREIDRLEECLTVAGFGDIINRPD